MAVCSTHVALRLAWVWLVLGGLWHPSAQAQLIDTVHDSWVTADDSLNKHLEVMGGFTVHILKPEVRAGSGYKVKNGFTTYYIFAVETEAVFIDSFPLRYNGQPMLLAVASLDKRLSLPDTTDTLTSRALFLKGIVIEPSKQEQRAKTKAERDSLRALADSSAADSQAAADYQLARQAQQRPTVTPEPAATDSSSAPKRKKGLFGLRLSGETDSGELETLPDSTAQPQSPARGRKGQRQAEVPDTTAADTAQVPPDPYPNATGKAKEWFLETDRYVHLADSVQTLIDSTFMPEPYLFSLLHLYQYNAKEAYLTAAAYLEMERTGGSSGSLGKFFASHFFARSERFHVLSHPYGLPEYTKPTKPKDYKGLPEDEFVPDLEYRFGVYLQKDTERNRQNTERKARQKKQKKGGS